MATSGKESYCVFPSPPSSPLQGGAVTIYGVYLGGGIHGYTSCTIPQCFYIVPVSVASTSYAISVTSVNKAGDMGPKSTTTIYGKWTDGIKYNYTYMIVCTTITTYSIVLLCSSSLSAKQIYMFNNTFDFSSIKMLDFITNAICTTGNLHCNREWAGPQHCQNHEVTLVVGRVIQWVSGHIDYSCFYVRSH